MIHFFLRRKMFRDDAFFVDFQCTVLKLVSQTVPFKGVSLHIFDSICVCQILLILTLRHVYLRRKVLNLKIVDESPKFKKSRLS